MFFFRILTLIFCSTPVFAQPDFHLDELSSTELDELFEICNFNLENFQHDQDILKSEQQENYSFCPIKDDDNTPLFPQVLPISELLTTPYVRLPLYQIVQPTQVVSQKPTLLHNTQKPTCLRSHCHVTMYKKGLCKRHFRKTCQEPDCKKLNQGGGFCIRHGGGKRCRIATCQHSVRQGDLCGTHGGGKRCFMPQCTSLAKRKGLCTKHSNALKSPPPSPDDFEI